MESCAMSQRSKLQATIWGISVNAEGALAVGAAFIIVMSALATYWF
jgi:hypothetical protein